MINPNTFTERLLKDAGISIGMKVLDIGCGNGEVSFLISKLVGESGEVVGVDVNNQAIALGRKRAEESKISNVTFVEGKIPEAVSTLGQFDAVVGRRILMYLANPVETLKSVKKFIIPGGLFIFQESDSTMVPYSRVPMPLHDKVVNWMWKTVEQEGADIHMGFNLPSLFNKVGISTSHIRTEPVIQGQGTHYSLEFIMRAMLPRITKHNVATEVEIDIDTLEQRLSEERSDDTVYISDMAFGIWGYKPDQNLRSQ